MRRGGCVPHPPRPGRRQNNRNRQGALAIADSGRVVKGNEREEQRERMRQAVWSRRLSQALSDSAECSPSRPSYGYHASCRMGVQFCRLATTPSAMSSCAATDGSLLHVPLLVNADGWRGSTRWQQATERGELPPRGW